MRDAARPVSPPMITDSEFIAAADRALAAIGEALDAALADADADVDWSLNDGILEIECDDGSKLIVNRHVPNREIWVAARSPAAFTSRPRDGALARHALRRRARRVALAALLRAQAGLDGRAAAARRPRRKHARRLLEQRRTSRRARAAPPRGRDAAARPAPRTAAND